MAEAACGTPPVIHSEKARMPFTAVKAATMDAPPYIRNRELIISSRRVWNRLFRADGLPVEVSSCHSCREWGMEIPGVKLELFPKSRISPNPQAKAVEITLARLAPKTPRSMP